MTLNNDQRAVTRKTYFISDLHLNENQPNITNQFYRFLADCDNSVDAIYILGDLFEAWIGDDDKTPFHLAIMKAIKKTVKRGIPVYFLAGNRDFLIGQQFAKETGVVLLQDEHIINLYYQRTLLMHGDTLCINDTGYQKARRFLRNQHC
jgi:UDP-2,3-diacylglucosamine hydrolase